MQEQLYHRFSPKMYTVCLRYSGNAEDARDLLQEGFIKIFKNLSKYRGDGSFEGWIRRIFVNKYICRMLQKHRKEHWRIKNGMCWMTLQKKIS